MHGTFCNTAKQWRRLDGALAALEYAWSSSLIQLVLMKSTSFLKSCMFCEMERCGWHLVVWFLAVRSGCSLCRWFS